MPIETAIPIQLLDQESFHQIDRVVTGFAFDIHNEFGRYLDEKLYQHELTRRCREHGFEVEPELRMTARFGDFSKEYYADHLINRGVIVEDKAVAALTTAHRGQTLNYLYLCGLQHATLLNFRSERVQHEFVSTRLTPARRRQFEFLTVEWRPLTNRCHALIDILHSLLNEWGAFLDPVLYRDAVTFFLGGQEQIVREVSFIVEGAAVGSQLMHLLTSDVAFSISASTRRPDLTQDHQRRFLRHTPLRAIQWINFNHQSIELRTITKS